MKTELVRVGNSRGIRIPKPIIEQCRLGNTVELRIEDDRLIISSERRPWHDWADAFRAAGAAEQDQLLLASVPANKFVREEWKW
jgi:antitoxin MazE